MIDAFSENHNIALHVIGSFTCYRLYACWVIFLDFLLSEAKERKCLVSGYPTDPNILGPTQT